MARTPVRKTMFLCEFGLSPKQMTSPVGAESKGTSDRNNSMLFGPQFSVSYVNQGPASRLCLPRITVSHFTHRHGESARRI
jgi:hypothetical protein